MHEKVYLDGNQCWEKEYAKVSMDYSKASMLAVIHFAKDAQKEMLLTWPADEYQPTGLGFGEIFGYTEIDGKLYHWIVVDYTTEERAVPEYSDSLVLIAPLSFDGGKVELEPFEVFEGEYTELINKSGN